MQNRRFNLYSPLFCMFAFVFLASCGGGGGSGGSTSADSVNHDEPNSAAITFELQIQPGDVDERNASLGRLAAEADICRDYSIDAFEVVVTWGGDLENERLVTWPCNDHSGMIDKLPTDVPLNLSINGIVDGQIQWHAEFNNLVLNPGETRSLGYITLGYVGNDRQGPQMVATVPPANAQGVDPSAAVSIQLDEPLAVSSIMDDALRLSADGADVSGTVEYDPGSRTIRFIPDQVLLPEKLYNAVLDAAITDIAGNAMESDYTWSFTTQAYGIHISKTGSGNGTVTSDPAGIDCGSQCSTDFSGISTVTLTAVPADDSTFIGWSGGGCTGTGSCTTTITGPIAVSAEFAIKTYTITATAGSGGAISPSGAVTVDHGASQRFTITANTGYYLSSLLVDNVIVPTQFTYTFSNVTSDRAIAAIFSPIPEDALSVSKTGSGNGTVTSDPAGINCGSQCMAQFTEGTAVTLTAAAAADSTFTGWSGGGCSGTGSCTTTINDPVAVSAEFAIKTYTITATAGSGGTISPSGAVTVNHGADRTFTISANAGYYLSRLRVDGANVTAASTYTFSNVTGNHTIEAVFAIRTYTITATAGSGGTISPSGTVTVNHGADRTFTISADAGYHLSRLRVDGTNVSAASTYTFSNVTGNHTIEAVFAIRTYTITATAGSGGTISPSGTVTVNHGANRTFTISADAGYHLSRLRVDGTNVSAASTYTFFNVTANHTIEAVFAIGTYTITATAGTGGTISPSGTVTVNHGANRTFTISANAGYYLSRLRVDGANVTAASTYTFSNVTGNHTIEAVFAIRTCTITAWASIGGTISPQGSVSVNHGAGQNFAIVPETGFYLSELYIDDLSVTPISTYSFSNVTSNHSIAAYFAYKTYGLNFSPYMDGQDPTMGSQISEQQLRTRMEIIEPHTVWIRTFGSSSGLEKSGAIAHDLGLKAALGAWIGSDSAANEHEIGNLIAAAQAGEADLLIVGSEVLLRGDLSENELIYYIDRVKQEVPGLPVGYADSCGVWLSHPNIINAVDIVLVNYYPYWEGIRIDWAVTAVNDWHTQVTAAANGKPVIVGGTGWPSYGDQIGNAIPSPDNASFYFLDFVSWAHANDVDYFYFEAFDESWKAAYEGPQGAHWGIWDKDGMLKPGMERVFNGEFIESN